MQHTRTAADTLQNRRSEGAHAESIVIRELIEEGMKSRVLQIHGSILVTHLEPSSASRARRRGRMVPVEISDWAKPK